MVSSYIYKSVRRAATYGFFFAMALIAFLTYKNINGHVEYSSFQKLTFWPFTWEFFIEMVIAIEASWIILSDMVNGTYKNVVAGGVRRRNYFWCQLVCVLTMITVELVFASFTYFYFLLRNSGLEGVPFECLKMYGFYLLLIWARHLTIATVCASLGFMFRKLYVMMGAILVVFSLMFLDAASGIRTDLAGLAKIMSYMPHATAKVLRDQIFMGNIPVASSIINTLPTIAIAVIVVVVAMIVFEKADLN